MTIYRVVQLFGEAYLRTAIPKNAVSAFQQTGIFPCNRDAFDDENFGGAEVTEQPEEDIEQSAKFTEQQGETTELSK